MQSGDQIGRYKIKSKVGESGMADFYLAYDTNFERDVTIKAIKPVLLHSDPTFRQRFERGAKIIAQLEHPSIVPIYDVGEHDGQPYLVMRYMSGGSLADRIRSSGTIPLEDAINIIEQIAPGLDEAHAKGFVHRDIKPRNIVFDNNGKPYISDFGIARLARSKNPNITEEGIIGTPAYMSPEQAGGENVDGRSDIYALGIVLYEMLTGRVPYDDTTPIGIAFKHIQAPLPRILDVNPNLPREIDGIIQKAMAKNPDDRYPTAQELVDALKSLSTNTLDSEETSNEIDYESNTNVAAKGPTEVGDKGETEYDSAANVVVEEPVELTAEQIAEREARLQAAIEANRLTNNRSQPVFNDRAQGDDQLGIKDEVEALAETLLLRDVEPPVAVGVMGGWGSGKSFVMYLINQYVQATRAKQVKLGWADGDEKNPKIPAYVGHVYQVNFNAWTYAKSNLWASLMDTIFTTLNRQMQLERLLAYRIFSPTENPPTTNQVRDNLLAGGEEFKKIYLENIQLDQDDDLNEWRENLVYWSQHLLKETLLWNVMRGQQLETLEKLKGTEEQLNQLKARREQYEKEFSANEITAKSISDETARHAYFQSIKSFTLAFLSDQLSTTAKEELKKQNVKEEDIQKYSEEAMSLAGGLQTLINTFRRSRVYLIWTIIFLIFFGTSFFWASKISEIIRPWITYSVSVLFALAPILRVAIPWIIKVRQASTESRKILEGSYATQQAKKAEKISSTTDTPIPEKIAELQAEISNGSLPAYDALISILEAQAEEQRQKIGPSAKYSNLMEFVQSRLDTATYENQLGLMHQVRQDIDELTFSLVDNANKDAFPRGKPRVILYIDDLDRCPPPRVVEVLEAVQLLLNTSCSS